jgi:hypothetical protein
MMRSHPCSVLISLAMVVAGPSLAQTPDLFQSAPGPEPSPFQSSPGPAPVARPTPRPRPPPAEAQPAVAPQPAPAPPAVVNQSWEGVTGIWHVKATITGQKITGRIQCYDQKKSYWGAWGPTFEGTIDTSGDVAALTAPWAPWVDRRISGALPDLNIETISNTPSQYLNCPNGRVELKKIS